MQHIEKTFITDDGFTIHTERYLPADDDPKAVVLILHGYGEYFGRYKRVSQMLVEAGYAAYGIDHRGHGRSSGKRALLETFDHSIGDIKMYIDEIKRHYPDKKLFLLGHSMGSLIGKNVLVKYQSEFAGAILTGATLAGPKRIPRWKRVLGRILARIKPDIPIQPPLDPAGLTSDPEIMQEFLDEKIQYKGWWKAGMGRLMVDESERIQEDLHKITLPLLIMHGELDKAAPSEGSEIVYEGVGSEDKKLLIWDDMGHEIMNEVERHKVFDVIVEWLDTH